MKIAFFPDSMASFHGHSLKERPLGGMETAVIRLAEALHDLGNEVIVFSNLENPPLSEPLYLPRPRLAHLGEVDVFVGIREWRTCFLPVQCAKNFFWTGDSYDLMQNMGMGDRRVADKIDAFLAVSDWHAREICSRSGFPKEKTYVLRNGIYAEYFKDCDETKRDKRRLIYSSTPYRGLKFLPQIYKTLKPEFPDMSLHIFSDYKVYGEQANQAYAGLIQEQKLLEKEFSEIDGCYMQGGVTQQQLAREMMLSGILAYPNTFEETSCITAMEAQAAGCVVVTSNLGALPETIGDAGIIINEKPGSEAYIKEFIKKIELLFNDDEMRKELSFKAIKRAEAYSWKKIAEKFVADCLR